MPREGALLLAGGLEIPRSELMYRASRAGGAGGQHVNTSSTRIELLWNPSLTSALDADARARVAAKLSSRLDGDGWLRIVASARRSQAQNRDDAESRLVELIDRALIVPKRRKPTKPSRGAREARLEEKKRRGETKRRRRDGPFDT
jgi:ribosome-associated protein